MSTVSASSPFWSCFYVRWIQDTRIDCWIMGVIRRRDMVTNFTFPSSIAMSTYLCISTAFGWHRQRVSFVCAHIGKRRHWARAYYWTFMASTEIWVWDTVYVWSICSIWKLTDVCHFVSQCMFKESNIMDVFYSKKDFTSQHFFWHDFCLLAQACRRFRVCWIRTPKSLASMLS